MKLEMVNLKGQYLKIHSEIDKAVKDVINSTSFINGDAVKSFADNFAKYNNAKYVIPCANGTDALQIALMSLGLERGDEVIIPSFTYIATAEVIALLGLIPVVVDVDMRSFNISVGSLLQAISSRTKAIIPVHLYGQSVDMEPLLSFAKRHNLYVVEDNAQSVGAEYRFSDGTIKKTGTMGDIGCTSFFPSKNLGCYGDGGALITDNDDLAEKIKMIANHGQKTKYIHDVVGCNSRLDSIQAAILNVKLKYLDKYNEHRRNVAEKYTKELRDFPWLTVPRIMPNTTHVFHQYTLQVTDWNRDKLREYLSGFGIPTMIYYPKPIHLQPAYKDMVKQGGILTNSETLASEVLSLPIHTELSPKEQDYIIDTLKDYED